jgi:hypothetical protein
MHSLILSSEGQRDNVHVSHKDIFVEHGQMA